MSGICPAVETVSDDAESPTGGEADVEVVSKDADKSNGLPGLSVMTRKHIIKKVQNMGSI